jgi:hypothetical protein
VRRGHAEVTDVDLSGDAAELWGAMLFLAVVCYPEAHEMRDRSIDAMRTFLARAHRQVRGSVPAGAHLEMKTQQQDGHLRRMNTRLRKRLLAGRIGVELMLKGAGGPMSSKLPTRAQAASLSRYAERRADRANFFRDDWRPEILHLCLALTCEKSRWHGPRPFCVQSLVLRPAWAPRALRVAESFAIFGPKARNMPPALAGFAKAKLIRLLPC